MVNHPVSITGESAKKRKRVSKKTKKSWRKHVDTKDVDNFLEDERLEERLGTPFSKRTDSEIFVVDSVPDIELINLPVVKSKAERRLALRNSEPKCYSSLKSYTAVPDPIAKRNRVRTPEERRNPIAKKIEESRKRNGVLKLKERVAMKNQALALKMRKNRPKRGEFIIDMWTEEPIDSKQTSKKLNCEWYSNDTVRHNTPANRKIRVKPPSIIKAVAAVEEPHPGTSYNPSFEDHQELLHEIANKEIQLEKEERHLERVTTKMFKKVSAEENQKNWLSESSQGLPTSQGGVKSESEDEADQGDYKSINPPVENKKKTKVQRRKQREQKQLALKLKNSKIEKKKVGDIYKLKVLKKQIEGKELKEEVTRDKRKKTMEKKALEPKVLSRTKFEPPELDFKMGAELTGNLRNSDPVGNLLRDRYKSLQRRNIVAPSTRVLKLNKAKIKKFIKPDHKITWAGNKA